MVRKINLIPMAGEGIRFKIKGFKIPKPLILINGIPMFVKATKSLPKADKYIFICLKRHINKFNIDKIIKNNFPNSQVISLKRKTNGQAVTCMKAINYLKNDDILTIGSCDYSMKYSKLKFKKLLSSSDLVVWTFKNKKIVKKNPNMYGYVKINKNGKALKVTCKKRISDNPWNDHTIIGTFSFKKAKDFIQVTRKLLKKRIKIKNEYYLDSVAELCLRSGLDVKVNLVKKYFGYGTPSDLKNYE